MAGVKGTFTAAAVALSAATAKSVITILAPTNQRLLITRVEVTFNGASATNVPVAARMCKATTAGTGTANTPIKRVQSDSETLQASGLRNLSAEPTLTDVFGVTYIPPTGGVIFNHLGYDPLPVVGGQRWALELTAPDAVSCNVTVDYEE